MNELREDKKKKNFDIYSMRKIKQKQNELKNKENCEHYISLYLCIIFI